MKVTSDQSRRRVMAVLVSPEDKLITTWANYCKVGPSSLARSTLSVRQTQRTVTQCKPFESQRVLPGKGRYFLRW